MPQTIDTVRRRRVVAILAGCVGVALAGWEGTLAQSAPAAHWSVLGLIALGIAGAVVVGRGRQRLRSNTWARRGVGAVAGELTGADRWPVPSVVGVLVWVALIAAVIGWDINSFAHQSHDLPTLSHVIGDVTSHDWGRALVFAGWMALGGYLAAGWRRPAGPGAGAGAGEEAGFTGPPVADGASGADGTGAAP